MLLSQEPPKSKDYYDYPTLINESFQHVIRQILKRCATENELRGEHHFYITFQTNHPDVDIPEHLRITYPHEMTIILQYEFFNLQADDERFEVTLYFNKQPACLKIPYHTIIAFFDPSVDIRLFLSNPAQDESVEQEKPQPQKLPSSKKPAKKPSTGKHDGAQAQIISFEEFRQKKS